jgi:hypothetical protein
MSDYWFKPKPKGYGAYPINSKGWYAILAYFAALVAVQYPFIIAPSMAGTAVTRSGVGTSLILTLLTIYLFLGIMKAKTDGQWKWRH